MLYRLLIWLGHKPRWLVLTSISASLVGWGTLAFSLRGVALVLLSVAWAVLILLALFAWPKPN